MAKVKSVVDTILGEAAYGTPQQRYADMVNIASVIANRAAQTRTTPQQVVSVRSEFNAYGKPLPAGAEKYRSLAQQALDDVLANGPKHNATFYATPKAAKNLPKGLKQVASTSGHVYFTDPQNRAIRTAVGFVKPVANAVQQVAKQTVNTLGDVANAVTAPVRQVAAGAGNIASALRTAAFNPISAPRPTVDIPSAVPGTAADLHPAYRAQAQAFLDEANRRGLGLEIASAVRTPAQQNALYAQGRTAPGSKVTNAPAGYSHHNFGTAFDVVPSDLKNTKNWSPEDPRWSEIGKLAREMGLSWGGDFKSIKDMPHIQAPGVSLGEMRRAALDVNGYPQLSPQTDLGIRGNFVPTPTARPSSTPDALIAAPLGKVERAPLQAAAPRMPDAARFAYDVPTPKQTTSAKVDRLPTSTVKGSPSFPGIGPTAYTYEDVPEAARRNPIANLAVKTYELFSPEAQAAPRPNNPSLSPAALGRGSVTAPSFASARMVAPQISVPTQRFERPATPTQQAAAYNQYAQSRMAPAPVEPPAPNANMSLADQYASYGAGKVPNPTPALNAMMSPVATVAQSFAPVAPQPQFVPAMPITPPPAPPPAPMPVQQVRAAPRQQFPSAPPAQPQYTAADVYAGRANSGVATGGNMVSRDQWGNTSVTNKYGVTTTTGPNGQQMASSGPGIAGPLGSGGIGSVFDAQPDLNGRSKFGNTARQVGAGMAGSAVGGLLGPIGSLVGAAIARDLATPGGGFLGGLLNGTRTLNMNGQQMQFARPQSGGAFPNAPSGGFRDPTFSNRSDRSMRDISPKAARDIKSGTAGLF